MSKLLAFDLGAESGRAIVGNFDGQHLTLEELHRFANGPVAVFDRLYWDPLRLFAEMQQGLALFAREHGGDLAAIGVDTWGVDYALLDTDDALRDNPRNYRDSRTDGMLEAALALVPRAEICQHTGVQFMKINTLYQVFSQRDSPMLQSARTFLMMADLFNFYFKHSFGKLRPSRIQEKYKHICQNNEILRNIKVNRFIYIKHFFS